MSERDCDYLGLDDAELASLTGFTRRVAQAVAHLREAWSVADNTNIVGVELALCAIFSTRSVQGNRGMFERVMTSGFDESIAAGLLERVRRGSLQTDLRRVDE